MPGPVENLLDPLWAATLDDVAIDLCHQRVVITAHALDGDKHTDYVLECDDVRGIRYVGGDRGNDWNYVEITEAEIERVAEGRLEVRFEFWVPGCEMILNARDVRLDIRP